VETVELQQQVQLMEPQQQELVVVQVIKQGLLQVEVPLVQVLV